MAIMAYHSRNLVNARNDATFTKRIASLQNKEQVEYDNIVTDIGHYSHILDEGFLNEVKSCLEITDEIIHNSHDTYRSRAQLFEYIEAQYIIHQKSSSSSRKTIKKLTDEETS